MKYTTPEKIGIKSENIEKFIRVLEENNLAMHDIIIARGDSIGYEAYWKPFDESFAHRQYSVTKSIISIAVGFAIQDGLLDIDKTVVDYFPEETKNMHNEYKRNLTIRHMLTMTTTNIGASHLADKENDRVQHYFTDRKQPYRSAGAFFRYDSEGTFVVCALIERLAKQKIGDYLYDKLFKHIGIEKGSYEFLSCPGGHTWGDSALIMRPEDMLKIARFTLNYGTWEGKRLLNEAYLKTATSKLVDNSTVGDEQYDTLGYGYYIWRTYENSFAFFGMGNQEVICVPHKDIIFVCNADNQGKQYARKVIFDSFFKLIVDTAEEKEIEEDKEAVSRLKGLTSSLTLAVARGRAYSDFSKEINGRTYFLTDNDMGIKHIMLKFFDDGGEFIYENAQGNKIIPFGMCKNVFFDFPQRGYSYEMSSVPSEHLYHSAGSASWLEDKKLLIKVQAIDKYFGLLDIILSFVGNEVFVSMTKAAEDFFGEYSGEAVGSAK